MSAGPRAWVWILVGPLLVSCSEVAPTAQEGESEPPVMLVASQVTSCGPGSARECPLQSWMKANATGAMTRQDAPALARVFERIASFEPPEYEGGWVRIAKSGAAAAAAGDFEGSRAACKGCHETFRDSYRATMRARPIE